MAMSYRIEFWVSRLGSFHRCLISFLIALILLSIFGVCVFADCFARSVILVLNLDHRCWAAYGWVVVWFSSSVCSSIPARHIWSMSVARVDRLTSRSMILTLREVLMKRHCVLKERLRL